MAHKHQRVKFQKTRCFKCGIRPAGHLLKPYSPYCAECEPRQTSPANRPADRPPE
jgi:hypothetical protein